MLNLIKRFSTALWYREVYSSALSELQRDSKPQVQVIAHIIEKQLRSVAAGMEVHRTEPELIDGEIESVQKLYWKMQENVIDSTIAGDFYRLLKGIQEISEATGIKEITQIRIKSVDGINSTKIKKLGAILYKNSDK